VKRWADAQKTGWSAWCWRMFRGKKATRQPGAPEMGVSIITIAKSNRNVLALKRL